MKRIRTLIFDADDTLWENNIFYENTRKALLDLCAKNGTPLKAAEQAFIKTETRIVHEKGYGTANFLDILELFFSEILPESARDEFEQIVYKFKSDIQQPRQLFPGVIETLQKLSKTYTMYVLTKGDYKEQTNKIDQSGLNGLFSGRFVESEKNMSTYQRLIAQFNWQVKETCMIGNSPKSDINPALKLGMNAIYIHYPSTWYLDDEPLLNDHENLITLKRFSDLTRVL